jgi:hypothetical protein
VTPCGSCAGVVAVPLTISVADLSYDLCATCVVKGEASRMALTLTAFVSVGASVPAVLRPVGRG